MFNLHNFIQFLSTNILQDWKSRSQKHALKFKLDFISLQLETCVVSHLGLNCLHTAKTRHVHVLVLSTDYSWTLETCMHSKLVGLKVYISSPSRVKPGFIGHFFEIATLNSDITGCRRIGWPQWTSHWSVFNTRSKGGKSSVFKLMSLQRPQWY